MSRKLSFSLAVRSLQGGCEFLRASFALKLSVVQIAAPGRPAQFEMGGIVFTRMSYVFEIVGQLESTHPQAVADMLAHASMFTIGPDGIASSARHGDIMWAPRQVSAQLTEAFVNQNMGSPSAAAALIGSADLHATYSKPFTAELPAAILEIVAAEPLGAVGLS